MPRLLDLFSCAGGAAVGYHRAGFEVVGVDVARQPRYPFEHVVADALEFLAAGGARGFDAVHASPPCQAHSAITRVSGAVHADLIEPTRVALEELGLPYVIENVPGAPLVDPVVICGTMFDPVMEVQRHRLFETNWELLPPMWPCRHLLNAPRFPKRWSKRDGEKLGRVVSVVGNVTFAGEGEVRRRAMGIDWMTMQELNQAIPPAYTEFIGAQLFEVLR